MNFEVINPNRKGLHNKCDPFFFLGQANYLFMLSDRQIRKLCCASPGVGYIDHDIVELLDHPLVAP